MAMTVVLYFEDDERAKEFVETQLSLALRPKMHLLGDVQGAIVKGIYKFPTMFCDIMDGTHPQRRVQGFTRGLKWGWWVCSTCHKPKKFAWDNFYKDLGADNLIERLFPEYFTPAEETISSETSESTLEAS